MERTQTVIIGAGQAGLAMSRILTENAHDHVVLERGRVAQRWRERWDSLRLLTPNWMNRLPGWCYSGDRPHGYMTRDEVVGFLRGFAGSFDAPVLERTRVRAVAPAAGAGGDRDAWRWYVETDRGSWRARNVVVATGHCDLPNVPACAASASPRLHQATSHGYRSPDQLPAGGVLIVGASASGVQLADELRRSGRRVVIAVGNHNRLPRRYRGRDIMVWLERLGALDRDVDTLREAEREREEPSLQLVGCHETGTLDLAVLHSRGVELAGRLIDLVGSVARFAGDLRLTVAKADLRLRGVVERIEAHVAENELADLLPDAEPVAAVPTSGAPRVLDLEREGIQTILWATGYRRSYPWLHAPVLDDRGEIEQRRGRTRAAGLYVLGLNFMIRRRSSFVGGVGLDALELAADILRDAPPERAIA